MCNTHANVQYTYKCAIHIQMCNKHDRIYIKYNEGWVREFPHLKCPHIFAGKVFVFIHIL